MFLYINLLKNSVLKLLDEFLSFLKWLGLFCVHAYTWYVQGMTEKKQQQQKIL